MLFVYLFGFFLVFFFLHPVENNIEHFLDLKDDAHIKKIIF